MVKNMLLKMRSLSLLLPGILMGYEFTAQAVGPEPAGWYAGDMHVHRSCGGSPVTVSSIYNTMIAQDLSVVSLLADMGNGEVQNPVTDLPLVTGQNDPVSTAGRIVHWDAEWHWDATYSQYPHHALGGHILALGLTNAYQIWQEYTYPIFDWTHRQGGIAGFAHMQYLDDGFPQDLNCCIPIEYPVEVALGACDFIAEDVNGSDTFIHAYYRLLNCGFRPGLAAGSDYPCGSVIGPLLTYSRVAGGSLTYSNWIGGIAKGRTAVSRNGRSEFLDLKVNGSAMPGDEIQLPGGESMPVDIQWTANQNLWGTIELVYNGEVVASEAVSGVSGSLSTIVDFTRSGWLCARRMSDWEHEFHTAAVFVTVDQKPVRASVTDAQFYVQWMDNLLQNTSPGGIWSSYFITNRAAAQARYSAARSIYQQIATEAAALASLSVTTISLSNANLNVAYTETLAAAGGTLPYTWSLAGGSLPPGLTLTANGVITGTPTTPGTFDFIVQVRDAENQTSTKQLRIIILQSFAITTTSLPNGVVSTGYSVALVASGGTTPYIWSITGGSLPSGLTLNPNSGVIAGTPTAAGTFSFTVRVSDASNPAQTATQSLSLVILLVPDPTMLTIWPSTTVPGLVDQGLDSAVELGVKFQSDTAGTINGIRFYKAVANTGIHVGNLWTRTGTLLATVIFSNETTSGWQQALFATPVAIASNTVYVASYHANNGHYSADLNYFLTGVNNPPLHALTDGVSGGNGVYAYDASSVFPNQTYNAANYWVDVVLHPMQSAPLVITTTSLPIGVINVAYLGTLTAINGTPPYTWSITDGSLPSGLTLNPNSGVIAGMPTTTGNFSFTVEVRDAGNPVQTAVKSLSLVIVIVPEPAGVTIWPNATAPELVDAGLDRAVELGVKFKSDVAGTITGIRFYKAMANTGIHVGNLWTSTGTLLATVIFSNETASGWQQALFATPVAIASNTIYMASYHANNGHYSADFYYFLTGVDNPPLHALTDGVSGGNGVYAYGASSVFPNQTYNAVNYWVDVVLQAVSPPTLTSLTVMPANPSIITGASQPFTAIGTYSDGSTQNLTTQAAWTSSNTGVATINASGLATGVSTGTTTISATLAGVVGFTTLTVQAPRTLTSIALMPANPSIITGASQPFTAIGTYSDGSTQNLTTQVVWTSSNTGVATINASGLATGVSTGTTTISATLAGVVGFTTLTVQAPRTLTSIALMPANPSIITGASQPFTAIGTYSDGSTQNLTTQVVWTSSNTGVATINASGLATGVSTGTTTISATLAGVVGFTTLTVQSTTLVITTASLSNGVINVAYSRMLTAVGGTLPYTWSIIGGSLPAGLTLTDGGIISGTPTTTGTFSFVVQVSDAGNPTLSASKSLSLVIVQPISITTVSLPNAVMNAAYSRTLTAVGGTLPYTWSIIGGSFPAGLTLTDGGIISGTPTTTGTFSFVVQVSDAGNPTLSASKSLSLVIVQPISITTVSLPNAITNVAYSRTLTAAGGTAPYTWSLTGGSLPPGLTLTGGGIISGTPTTTGSFSFTAQVRDAGNPQQTATKLLGIKVVPAEVTIWPSAAAPQQTNGGLGKDIELGVKFQSDVAGTIIGVRFYKSKDNTGTHVGNLWSSAGVRLATDTFEHETATGWQQVLFPTPVTIASNTVYVVSYSTTKERYALDNNYFLTSGVDNPPLHALANSISGGNGVYGKKNVFPTQTQNAANYWVDVVFKPIY